MHIFNVCSYNCSALLWENFGSPPPPYVVMAGPDSLEKYSTSTEVLAEKGVMSVKVISQFLVL